MSKKKKKTVGHKGYRNNSLYQRTSWGEDGARQKVFAFLQAENDARKKLAVAVLIK